MDSNLTFCLLKLLDYFLSPYRPKEVCTDSDFLAGRILNCGLSFMILKFFMKFGILKNFIGI